MNRRDFLRTVGMTSATLAVSDLACLHAMDGGSDGWRTFEVTTRVEILHSSGATRVWLPAALINKTPYQSTISNTFVGENGTAEMIENPADAMGIVRAKFPSGVKPVLTLTSKIATKDCTVDLLAPGNTPKANRVELEYFLRSTRLLPTDGIVKKRATEITKGARTDVDKARAIYEWIVANTFRDAKTRGCGLGDIRYMLESGDLGGKCADLNALYVGLARSAGLPARDAYGIRVAKSEVGYKSLGTSSETITRAQHCRAEVWLANFGWVPIDPADVRKVALEEPPGNRPMTDSMVQQARKRLFGSWEMNWIAYNFAHDVSLPGSSGEPIGFFMYPQAETSEGRLDCLDPESFRYEIASREITSI